MSCGCGGNQPKKSATKKVASNINKNSKVRRKSDFQESGDVQQAVVIQQTNLCADNTFCTRAVTDPDLLCLNGTTLNAYRIEFVGEERNTQANTTTLIYNVCSCGRPDISHFGFEICPNGTPPQLNLVATRAANPGISPGQIEIINEGQQSNEFGFRYLKFDVGLSANQCREVSLVFNGLFTVEGSLGRVGVKAGQLEPVGLITGVAGICGCPFDPCECGVYDNSFECELNAPDCLTPVGDPRVAFVSMGSSTQIEACRVVPDNDCGDPDLICPDNPQCRDKLHAEITVDVYVSQDYEDECGNSVQRCCSGRITVQKDCFACRGQFTALNCMTCEHLVVDSISRVGNQVTVDFDINCSSYLMEG